MSNGHTKKHGLGEVDNHLASTIEELNGLVSDGVLVSTPDGGATVDNNIIPIDKNTVPLIVIIGQSNADGRGGLTNLSETLVDFYSEDHPHLKIYYKPAVKTGGTVTSGTKIDDGEWYTLKNDHSDIDKYTSMNIGNVDSTVAIQSASQHGPELQLGYDYFQEFGHNELRIIKFAVGSSSLKDHWLPTDGLYDTFMRYVYQPAIRAILREGKKPTLLGVLFNQGEGDANSTNSPLYQANLETLISQFRADSGFENATFNIVQLSDFKSDSDWLNVKAVQATISSSDIYTNLIVTDGSDDLPSFFRRDGDEIHFSTQGQSQIVEQVWPLLNYTSNSDYTKCHAVETFAAYTGTPGTFLDWNCATENGKWGSLVIDTLDGEKCCSWQIDNRGARPLQNSHTVRSELLNVTDDFEMVMTSNGYTDSFTKPSILFRGVWAANNDNPTAGYLFQIKAGDRTIKIFKREGGTWNGFPDISDYYYTFEETDWDALGDVKYFKARLSGSTLEFYSSVDQGKTWTNRVTTVDTTYTTGDAFITLFNGLILAGDAHYWFKEIYGDTKL